MATREELERYRETVEYYAKKHENYMLHNKGPEHAVIVFENMFREAKSHIRIAAGTLCCNPVTNDTRYLNALESFLNMEGTQLDIFVSEFHENDIHDSPFFQMLVNTSAFNEDRITVRNGEGQSFRLGENPMHFCIADGMYRVEDDINERRAVCNFGDDEADGVRNHLTQLFDESVANIAVIPLQTINNLVNNGNAA